MPGVSSHGTHPDFGRSINPMSTKGGKQYIMAPPNFQPSYGPFTIEALFMTKTLCLGIPPPHPPHPPTHPLRTTGKVFCHYVHSTKQDIERNRDFLEVLLELVSKELNHLAAILHVYAGGLNFLK